ncbi:MAG: hypothetical protein H6955_06280 [Chromatiaceae bacterium]|nr:hypothetical protein [Chromatiaceae bacterium]
MNAFRPVVPVFLAALLAACGSAPSREQPVRRSDFQLQSIAKSDVDMITEIHIRQSLGYLRELARKLYVRNPNQLRRGRYHTEGAALQALFGVRRLSRHPDLGGRRSAEAIGLAFDDAYYGDRVAAFVEGLRTMLLDGYGGKRTFYLHDSLDPQKLHYLARNFEIAFWKLRHDRDPTGQLYLLSNSLDGNGDLSFERLAGKLIALQDSMAQVVVDSTNRQIKNVIQSVASAVFFPI